MPVTYTILPIPRWYFAENSGIPLGGGYMSTWRSIDKTTPKAIFSDAGGINAWTNPVLFDLNGEAPGPFFWANDEPYFIEVFQANGVLLFNMDNYGPAIAGGGGGGSTTTYSFLENYVVNNNFLSHGGTSVVGTPGIDTFLEITSGTVISPSNHHGLVKNATGQTLIPYAGPDCMYIRSNDTAPIVDNLRFSVADFNAGTVPLTGDITPEFYIDFECTNAGAGQTLKCVQFPIDLHVKNLEQAVISVLVWAKGSNPPYSFTANLVQYFGTGSATTPVVTNLISQNPLTTSWVCYVGSVTLPSVVGKVLGAGGDDATYLQICFPLTTTRLFFTKPKFYLGNIGGPFPELQSYDYVDRIINSPRTGDVRISQNAHNGFGWVSANNGSIGSAGSSASTRANIDTWPLYALLYTTILDHWAPVAGRTGATISTAITDFAAGRALILTRALGYVIAGLNGSAIPSQSFTTNLAGSNTKFIVTSSTQFIRGTPVQLTTGGSLPTGFSINAIYFSIPFDATNIQLTATIEDAIAGTNILPFSADGTGTIQTALGAYYGESLHALTGAENGPHTHNIQVSGNGGLAVISKNGGAGVVNFPTESSGSGTGHNTIQPTVHMNIFYKL